MSNIYYKCNPRRMGEGCDRACSKPFTYLNPPRCYMTTDLKTSSFPNNTYILNSSRGNFIPHNKRYI